MNKHRLWLHHAAIISALYPDLGLDEVRARAIAAMDGEQPTPYESGLIHRGFWIGHIRAGMDVLTWYERDATIDQLAKLSEAFNSFLDGFSRPQLEQQSIPEVAPSELRAEVARLRAKIKQLTPPDAIDPMNSD